MNVQALPIMAPRVATVHTNSANSGGSSTSGVTLNSNSAESLFIKLLATELQSQDPTSPMDPTQMVGQMFSMNQLQQLIDINQTLSAALGGAPSGAPTSGAALPSNTGTSPLQGMALPINAAASYAQQLLTGAH